MLGNDITKFMTDLPAEEIQAHWEDTEHTNDLDKTPFMHAAGEGVNAGMDESEWVVEKDKQKYSGTMLPDDGSILYPRYYNTRLELSAHLVKSPFFG